MKRVRGVLLPLALCGLILAAGVCAPALFGAAAPDYKDAPSAVDIAGAESPLYLESEADIRLPPWDVIDAHASLPLSAYTGLTEAEIHPALNQYIGALAAPFCGAVAEDQNFADAMRVSAGQFFYLRDYSLSEEQDGRTLSLVLDALGRPLYLHTRGAAEQAEPVKTPKALLQQVQAALAFWQAQVEAWPEVYSAEPEARRQWLHSVGIAAETALSGIARILVDQFVDFLLLYDRIAAEYLPEASFAELIAAPFYLEPGYVIDYDGESVIVLTDPENRPYTLYYNAAAQAVTGFGLDARIAGYTEIAERNPAS